MHETIEHLLASGKGILAADESPKSADARLVSVGMKGGVESRRQYRALFLETPGIERYTSGVILHDETLQQSGKDGLFLSTLKKKGIIPGIKVDQGKDPDAFSFGETITKGLDSLPERLPIYVRQGLRFAKWRAVIVIDGNLPTDENILHEANHLARYAKMCQEHDIVPIIEPEVVMDGDHNLAVAEDITTKTLQIVFQEMKDASVDFSCLLLKSSMVISGKTCTTPATSTDMAKATLRTFHAAVPTEVPGIVFLSGGQQPIEATEHLQAITSAPQMAPWKLSFSFARALQMPALKMWQGKPGRVDAARKVFLHRLRMNSLAVQGRYMGEQG